MPAPEKPELPSDIDFDASASLSYSDQTQVVSASGSNVQAGTDG
jgi:hypothetical protein